MAVTELALLRIVERSTESPLVLSAELRNHLRLGKEAMEKASGYKFYYLHCLEDSTLIFIVGGWPSIPFHMEEWIPSQENQALLKLLEGKVNVEWMFHLDLDPNERGFPLEKEMVTVGRHFVEAGNTKWFEEGFSEVREKLENCMGGKGNLKSGWRIDRGYIKDGEDGAGMDGEEWVLLTGQDKQEYDWESREYFKLRRPVEGVDIKHGISLWG